MTITDPSDDFTIRAGDRAGERDRCRRHRCRHDHHDQPDRQVHEEVLTASGAVETGYTAVALTNGVATASVHLGMSGDTVRVVDNPTAPAGHREQRAGDNHRSSPNQNRQWTRHAGVADFRGRLEGQCSLHGLGRWQTDRRHSDRDHIAFVGPGANRSTSWEPSPKAATRRRRVLNDAWRRQRRPPTATGYLTGATIDNSVVAGATITELVQGPRSFSFLAPGAPVSAPAANTVTVNHPASLAATVQTITGTEFDLSQAVFLDWRTAARPRSALPTGCGRRSVRTASSLPRSASTIPGPAGPCSTRRARGRSSLPGLTRPRADA